MLKEFKEFAMKGNVMDLAIGVIIGAAFGKIVSSLVNDIIMPIVSILTGGYNFKALKIIIKAGSQDGKIPETAIGYGMFIQNVIDFLIIALCIFFVVKAINSLKKKPEVVEEQVEVVIPEEQKLLSEIKDILTDISKK